MRSTSKDLAYIFTLLLTGLLFPLQALSQVAGQGTSLRTWRPLSAPQKRVVFASDPFSAGSVVPYWDKGYLISITPIMVSSGTSSVRLYNSSGNKVRESALWFPGATTVYIISAAVTDEGNIIASGTAVKADGTRAYFIAATDSSGNVTHVIQTNPFFPSEVCSASDGTVWSFGDLGTNSDLVPVDGDILRQFDFGKGLIHSHLPRSTFGKDPFPPAQRRKDGQEVYFRCLSDRLVIYTGTADQYIEFDTVTASARRFRLDRSVTNLPVRGFAVTNQGDVYGFLRDYFKPNAVQGLFHLDVDSAAGYARWAPVMAASGAKGEPGVVVGLWGADGEYLVHGYADDPAGRPGVSWSRPIANIQPR